MINNCGLDINALFRHKINEIKSGDIIIQEALHILIGRMRNNIISLSMPADVKAFLKLKLSEKENEVFSCIFLNTQNKLIQYQEMFQGSIRTSVVHPREIAKAALACNASAVILAHNHPGGLAIPSVEDISLTKALKAALELIDVNVLDHMIVSNCEVYSFHEHNIL
jgi:DNA repair protein RadC